MIGSLLKGFIPNSFGVVASQIYITVFELSRHFSGTYTQNEFLRNFFPGAVASLVSQSVVVPADMVSQRMMVAGQKVGVNAAPGAPPESSPKARTIFLQIFRENGVRGLFQGYWASICTFAPSSAVWWAVYAQLRSLQLQRHEPGGSHVLQQAMAGGAAGLVTAVVTNPLDTVRTRVQLASRAHGSMREVLVTLFKQAGVRGLMKGVTARMLHTAPNSALMIAAYEMVKRMSLKPTSPSS